MEREVERLKEATDSERSGSNTLGDARRLEEVYPEQSVRFVRTVGRNLFRIRRTPDLIANVEDPESVYNYLTLVRDEYGIDDDRDDAVRASLEEHSAEWHVDLSDVFAHFALAVPIYAPITNDDNTTLKGLVDADRHAEAEHALVSTVYELLADAGANAEMEVAA